MQKVSITRLNSLFIFGYTILIYLCSLSHVTSEASRNLSIRAQQQRCANQLDLMFVLDMSGSIGPHRWVNKVRPFVHRFVDSLSVSEKEVNIALMLYDDTTSIEWDFLDKKYDKKKILDDIDNLRYNGGGTYTWIALKKARDEVLFKVRDERKKVPKLIVLITDGVTNDREITDFASSIQKRGASIYVLGIQGAAQEQCRKMAGCPPYGDCKNFSFQNWDELLSNSKNFLAQVCETLPQDAECQSGVRHGNCSKECGGGERTVTYFYYQTQPPIAGSNGQKGKSCAELYQERTATETCNNMACTENAKCNEMGPFSDCSTTCGDGTKTRNRLEPLTLKPAVNGHKGPGQTCEEQGYQLTEVVPCKEKECPINELLSDWVDGKCNADCGPGLKKRSRSTLIPAQFSGKTAAEQGLATEKILRCEIKTCGLIVATSLNTVHKFRINARYYSFIYIKQLFILT